MTATSMIGVAGSTSILAAQKVIDMSDKIYLLEPEAAPLYVLVSKLNKRVAINPTFSWLEDDLNPSWSSASASATSAATVLTAASGEGVYFNKFDLLKVPSTGETMLVTASTNDTITVIRGYGTTTAATLAAAATFFKIGTAFEEGASYSSLVTKSTKTVPTTNYAQIFRSSVEITRTLANTELYGGSDRAYQRKKKGIELMRDLERAFFFGEALLDTGGTDDTLTHPRRTTKGINGYISTNSTDAGGTLTEAEFEGFLRTIFRYGSSTRYLFASPLVISVISMWAQGKLQMFPKDKTYGIAISQYLSPHGTINIVKDVLLENAGVVSNTAFYGGYAFGVMLEEIVYRYLQNRDISLETDIQLPGDDSYKDCKNGSYKRLLNRWTSLSKYKDNTEGSNLIIRHLTEVFPMKLKDAARLACLIETEGNIQVHRPMQRKGENCLSSPHISICITNTDLGILNWAKLVLEKELEHSVPLYEVSNSSNIRTKQCYRVAIGRFEDVHRILKVTRKLMLGIKKRIADLIVSFLNYRETINKNGYVHDKNYSKVFNELINKVEIIKQTYDHIKPVTTLRSPDLEEDQKIKSKLNGNIERSVEILDPHVSV